jgi:excisionase family DNA binding protein
MTENLNHRYLNTEEVAIYLRRTPGAVRNLVLRRRIPFKKPGGRLLFDVHQIDQWIHESTGISLDEILERAVRNGNGDRPGDPRLSVEMGTREPNAKKSKI